MNKRKIVDMGRQLLTLLIIFCFLELSLLACLLSDFLNFLLPSQAFSHYSSLFATSLKFMFLSILKSSIFIVYSSLTHLNAKSDEFSIDH